MVCAMDMDKCYYSVCPYFRFSPPSAKPCVWSGKLEVIMLIIAGFFYSIYFAYVSSSLLSSCSCRCKLLILGHSVYQCCNVACMLSPV
jgi:hypothetical protein